MEEYDLVGNKVWRKSVDNPWEFMDTGKVLPPDLQDEVNNRLAMQEAVMKAEVKVEEDVDADVTNVVEGALRDGSDDPTTDEDDGTNVHDLTSSEARQRFQYDDLLGLVTLLLSKLFAETDKDVVVISESELVASAEQKPKIYAEELENAWRLAMTGYEPPEAMELEDVTQRVRKGGDSSSRSRG